MSAKGEAAGYSLKTAIREAWMPQEEAIGKRPKVATSDKAKRKGGARRESLEKRNELITEYYDYVDQVVSKVMRSMRLPPSLKEEFLSAGTLGLIEAAGRYQADRGLKFKTFAFLRIRGAIIDHIRTACDLSGYAYRRFRVLEMAQQMREDELDGRPVTQAASLAAAAHGVEFLEKIAVAFLVAGDTEEDEAQSPDQEKVDPERQLLFKQKSKKIRALVATLPEKERLIIEQHYFQDRKLVDVAAQFSGLSKSWVSRLHDRALILLRDKIAESKEDLAA
ncbi:MAG: sigma-70 family RNA polymerase sigma factor [Pseudomonadota bacterium]|jgi:RNA polymerase sigma factor for flagellar operon FliA